MYMRIACENALRNPLICITNNEYLMLHHKTFCADYVSRSTKICAPGCVNYSTTRIFIQVKYVFDFLHSTA